MSMWSIRTSHAMVLNGKYHRSPSLLAHAYAAFARVKTNTIRRIIKQWRKCGFVENINGTIWPKNSKVYVVRPSYAHAISKNVKHCAHIVRSKTNMILSGSLVVHSKIECNLPFMRKTIIWGLIKCNKLINPYIPHANVINPGDANSNHVHTST